MTRHAIGVDNLIWGNDYPHHDSIWPHSQEVLDLRSVSATLAFLCIDSIWPHSQEVLDRIFQGVPTDEKYKMTNGNVCKLYGITLSPEVTLTASQ